MNKYEIRAESVLKKREEYYKRLDARNKKIVKTAIAAVSTAVIICVSLVVKNGLSSSVDVKPSTGNTENSVEVTLTQAQKQPEKYNGKLIFIDTNEKNYGEYKTCYVNINDDEDPNNESNHYGVIDFKGELVVPPVYSRAYSAGENRFVVEKTAENSERMSALIDNEGKIVFDYFRGSLLPIEWENKVSVLIADAFSNSDYLINTHGEKVLNIGFESLFYSYTAVAGKGFDAGEMIKGIYNDEYYLINFKGEIVGIYNESPKVKKALSENLDLVAAYKIYQGNYKTLLFGVSDKNGKEIIPCDFTSVYYVGDRIIGRRGEEQGLDYSDVAVIYDLSGNLLCDRDVYHSIAIDYGADTGIGIVMGEWNEETASVVGGYWVIDKNGQKLSAEYDKIIKNSNKTYTAYYDNCSKYYILDEYGNIVK